MNIHDDCCYQCTDCGRTVTWDTPSPGEHNYQCADCYEDNQ